MNDAQEIIIRLPGGRRVEAQVGSHRILTDQPHDNGGDDSAPSPFNLFLASLGTCAGIFVQGFCAKRGIPTEGIELVQQVRYGPDGTLASVDIAVQLPGDFPPKYTEALLRVVDQCSVKKAIRAQPDITVRAVPGARLAQPPSTSRAAVTAQAS